ncbi:hypothetical protein PROFUN_16203, partial [Planoprotostelium fungivorum]
PEARKRVTIMQHQHQHQPEIRRSSSGLKVVKREEEKKRESDKENRAPQKSSAAVDIAEQIRRIQHRKKALELLINQRAVVPVVPTKVVAQAAPIRRRIADFTLSVSITWVNQCTGGPTGSALTLNSAQHRPFLASLSSTLERILKTFNYSLGHASSCSTSASSSSVLREYSLRVTALTTPLRDNVFRPEESRTCRDHYNPCDTTIVVQPNTSPPNITTQCRAPEKPERCIEVNQIFLNCSLIMAIMCTGKPLIHTWEGVIELRKIQENTQETPVDGGMQSEQRRAITLPLEGEKDVATSLTSTQHYEEDLHLSGDVNNKWKPLSSENGLPGPRTGAASALPRLRGVHTFTTLKWVVWSRTESALTGTCLSVGGGFGPHSLLLNAILNEDGECERRARGAAINLNF